MLKNPQNCRVHFRSGANFSPKSVPSTRPRIMPSATVLMFTEERVLCCDTRGSMLGSHESEPSQVKFQIFHCVGKLVQIPIKFEPQSKQNSRIESIWRQYDQQWFVPLPAWDKLYHLLGQKFWSSLFPYKKTNLNRTHKRQGALPQLGTCRALWKAQQGSRL